MRLSSLKLSGFKSFADSSTLSFRSNRTAVVGPNGCGKSNVIDAIRWVMGESSARQLRGGNMQDVIFTGTTQRKPVGMASVELRFENTYGKLGGSYNAYNELAVRRQVTRDGKSEYFLNGTKCRRRDITDIFLGTGLGPRSYAIIEQGMINRLVDAKPEEMRVFIEEAAGVSRYQARRRETMQHLQHTSQNLERLEDIASELNSQLKTLKRQSETAVQYKSLETEIRGLKIDILCYQSEHSSRLQQQYSVEMTTLGERFKCVRAELTTLEHDLSNSSELFQRLIQQSTPLQNESQQAEKKLAELKLGLEQKQDLIQHNSSSLTQLQQQKTDLHTQIKTADIQLESLYQQQQQQREQLQCDETDATQQQQQLQRLNTAQQQQLKQFEQIKALVDKQQQQQLHMQSQLAQLSKNIERIEQQKATLQHQLTQIQQQSAQGDLSQLQQEHAQLQQQIFQLEQQQQVQQQQLEQQQQQRLDHQAQLHQLQSEIKVLHAEHKTLLQLMAKTDVERSSKQLQLLQFLQLNAAGKAHAGLIEKFLAKWLDAEVLEVDQDFDADVARQLKVAADLPKLQLGEMQNLSDWIAAPQHSLWRQVAIATDRKQALAAQTQLKAGESILSLDGYHLGPDWCIALLYDQSSQAAQGALSHRVRLDEIEQQLQQLETQQQALAQLSPELELAESQSGSALKQTQQTLQQKQQQLQQLDVQMVKQQSATQAFAVQQQHLGSQIQQLDQQCEEDAMQKDDLEIDLHALLLKLEHNLPQYQNLQAELEQVNAQSEQQQRQLSQQQQQRDEARRVASETQQQIELLEKDLSFLQQHYQSSLDQIEQTQKNVEPVQLELPRLQTAYQQQAQITEKLQNTWKTWQVELNQVQEKQQHLTEQRHVYQQQDETLRTQLEQQRLAWQSAQSDLQHIEAQLKELGAEARQGVEIDLSLHQQKLDKSQQQFAKLGAVNLAASEEYAEVSQRYAELSHQIEDLHTTVTQLKDAMKSIDQETRKLFMDTFDRVNAELQILFPKVFNGGEAQLSLEGDWQSGVKLMARPPGKRNSSLALLSGGEKALTALALVFAIFRLNPAPFCVLDEVDAPLDDANVGRFCNLVKELSEQVQFIYITHNKVAMTMATDLLGVTMPDPGASKLVSVNLEEAKEYGLVAES